MQDAARCSKRVTKLGLRTYMHYVGSDCGIDILTYWLDPGKTRGLALMELFKNSKTFYKWTTLKFMLVP